MLFLLFDLDDDRYALDSSEIVEVLALTPVKKIPGAPAWVAGVFERGGEPVPVIDVAQLALGRAAHRLRSTRLVLVHYDTRSKLTHDTAHAGGSEPGHLLGLIVERATRTRRIEREQFVGSGVATPHAPWLGPVVSDSMGLIQWVEVQQMLNDETQALLFPGTASLQQAHT